MLHGSLRLAVLAAVLAFGATGAALALAGLGMPFLLASLLAAAAAGLVQYAALRTQPRPPPPDHSAEDALRRQLDDYRTATAALRHDLRGVLSPALMMSDRLLKHSDPSVQRAGTAVVRSIDRATAIMASNRETLAPASEAEPVGAPPPAR